MYRKIKMECFDLLNRLNEEGIKGIYKEFSVKKVIRSLRELKFFSSGF